MVELQLMMAGVGIYDVTRWVRNGWICGHAIARLADVCNLLAVTITCL